MARTDTCYPQPRQALAALASGFVLVCGPGNAGQAGQLQEPVDGGLHAFVLRWRAVGRGHQPLDVVRIDVAALGLPDPAGEALRLVRGVDGVGCVRLLEVWRGS